MPGRYSVKLTVNGKSYTQPLTVKMGPRVKTSPGGIKEQFRLSKNLYDGIAETFTALEQLGSIPAQAKALQERAGQGDVSRVLSGVRPEGGSARRRRRPRIQGGFGSRGGGGQDTLAGLSAC
jgi:hypothetical protein